MTIIYGILLQAKGDIKKIKVKETKDKGSLTHETLQDILKKKTTVSELGIYKFGEFSLTLFGYKKGKAGTENKHELPPPLDSEIYFSDILVIASKLKSSWKDPVNFTPDQYEKFYNMAFGGFESLDEDDEDDDEDNDDKDEDEDEEKEEIEISNKKKKAEDEGVPEDEEDKDAEEEDEIDEDGIDEEEGEDNDEGIDSIPDMGGDEDEVVPVKSRSSTKKKVVKANLTVIQNTGRAKQQSLLLNPGFQQIMEYTPICAENNIEKNIRSNTFTLIQKILGNKFSKADQIKIEMSIFNLALKDADEKFVLKNFDNKLFQICYTSSARRILGNLDPNSYIQNKNLYSKVHKGDLKIEHLATMNTIDLAPELYKEMRERQLLREQRQLEGNKSMATDMFKCGRCNKRETTFYELQTRSADEPMTKFINCVNCGHHWRM
jgi:DNA-directed RNA polymerase subunit M/transcription elongation factor TFIIS